MSYTPLIIIGAARSGTNMLRDTLTGAPGLVTWPCDEINLIWRHGNLDRDDDLFTREDARPEIARFIRRAFDRLARRTGATIIVEKTCANSMRVPFIDAIFPEARYLYIVRDGRDAALSAARRWTAPIEPVYLARKLRFAPLRDVPHHALRFVANRARQWRSRERALASWGPRFPGMDEWVARRPLIEVCAQQWTVSVDCADRGLGALDPARVFSIRYEDFVADPPAALEHVGRWLGLPLAGHVPAASLARIHSGSMGNWQNGTGKRLTDQALRIMASALERHGYRAAA